MKWLLLIAFLLVVGCGPSIVEGPDEPECTVAADCDDGDPCTGERCQKDGTCVIVQIGGECLP